MLRITKSTDPIEVKTVTLCIYANPGLGKTTLAGTANKPLLLDFDKGSYRAGNRGDVVQIGSWADVTGIAPSDLEGYSTLVVDTAGRALDALTIDIIESNPKMGRGGALTLQGYGELKSRFISWTKMVRAFGLDVVLIAHSDEQRKGDELIVRLDVQGSSKNEIYKSADVMGHLYLAGGKRMLNFSPTDIAFGKNPTGLPPLEVPHYDKQPTFLGGVLDSVKAGLNKQSAAVRTNNEKLAPWKDRIEKLATVDDFNAMLTSQEKPEEIIHGSVKKLLTAAAKKKGYTFDVKAARFANVLREGAAA